MNLLDGITFTTPGLRKADDGEGVRVWHTSDGDEVGLYCFEIAPDLPGDLGALAELRLALSQGASAANAVLVEADVLVVDGCKALHQCVKVPQQTGGMTYLGSLTFPYRDFSLVLKILCEERGLTGMRDALILNEKLSTGQVQLDPSDGNIVGWATDPNGTTRTFGLARNLADDVEYDQRFPDHPLSRARRFIGAAAASIHVSDFIRNAPPFIHSHPQAPNVRPWWKLW